MITTRPNRRAIRTRLGLWSTADEIRWRHRMLRLAALATTAALAAAAAII